MRWRLQVIDRHFGTHGDSEIRINGDREEIRIKEDRETEEDKGTGDGGTGGMGIKINRGEIIMDRGIKIINKTEGTEETDKEATEWTKRRTK